MAGFVLLVVDTMGWTKGPVRDLDRRIEGNFGSGFVYDVNEPHRCGHGHGHGPRGQDIEMGGEDELLPNKKHLLEPIHPRGTLKNHWQWTASDHKLNILFLLPPHFSLAIVVFFAHPRLSTSHSPHLVDNFPTLSLSTVRGDGSGCGKSGGAGWC
jgi:hypothetical protein